MGSVLLQVVIDPETSTIPVFFITATWITRENGEFAMDIGATRLIQKPIELNGLLTDQGTPAQDMPVSLRTSQRTQILLGLSRATGSETGSKKHTLHETSSCLELDEEKKINSSRHLFIRYL